MPRKGQVERRDVMADPIYNSKLVTRLINRLMLDGKKVLLNKSYTKLLKLSLNVQVATQWKFLKRR